MADREPTGNDEQEIKHPKEHKGLAARLKEMLTGSDPDNTSEQMTAIAESREASRAEAEDTQELRLRALKNLSGENGVVTADQFEVSQEMERIRAEDVASNEPSDVVDVRETSHDDTPDPDNDPQPTDTGSHPKVAA